MTTTSTPHSASDRDQHDFDAFFEQCIGWRRHLLRTWRNFADADAELVASMWQHWTRGVRDERTMFNRVSVDVRRFCRREARQARIKARVATTPVNFADTPIDDLVDHLGTAQLLDKLTIPDKARPWADHRCGLRDSISEAERIAGLRWSQRSRKVLAHA